MTLRTAYDLRKIKFLLWKERTHIPWMTLLGGVFLLALIGVFFFSLWRVVE